MLVSGIIVSASLIGALVVLLVAGVGLMLVDKHLDVNREH